MEKEAPDKVALVLDDDEEEEEEEEEEGEEAGAALDPVDNDGAVDSCGCGCGCGGTGSGSSIPRSAKLARIPFNETPAEETNVGFVPVC